MGTVSRSQVEIGTMWYLIAVLEDRMYLEDVQRNRVGKERPQYIYMKVSIQGNFDRLIDDLNYSKGL